MEEWRDIEGYEGYQVSSEGRIRSVDRVVEYTNGAKRFFKGRILKSFLNNCGYEQVYLVKDGKKKWEKIHRLVAKAFIPNPDNLPCVNHKDETHSHNNVENLEWCTQKYNVNYGTSQIRKAEKRSKKVYQCTLDGQLVKIWASTKECGRNGFDRSCISACCRGEQKTHKGYKWSYLPL